MDSQGIDNRKIMHEDLDEFIKRIVLEKFHIRILHDIEDNFHIYYFKDGHYRVDDTKRALNNLIREMIVDKFEILNKKFDLIGLFRKPGNKASLVRRVLKLIDEEYSIVIHENDLFDTNESIIIMNGIYSYTERKLTPHTPLKFSNVMANTKYIEVNNPNISDEDINEEYWYSEWRELKKKEYEITRTCPPKLYGLVKNALFDSALSAEENINRLDSFFDMMGYWITGDRSQKKIFCLVGATNSGKSTLQNVLQKILGHYVSCIDSHSILKTSRSSSDLKPEFIQSRNSRIIFASETDEKAVFDSKFLKSFSGNDTQVFRRPRAEKAVMFNPKGKIILSTNNFPKLSDIEDEALINRLVVVDFLNSIPQNKIDLTYEDKMMDEKEEIFSFLCSRASKYFENNKRLYIHPSFEASKSKLIMNQQDPITLFWKERIALRQNVEPIAAGVVYAEFLQYLAEIGVEKPISQTKFGRDFSKLVIFHGALKKAINGHVLYFGIAILNNNRRVKSTRRMMNVY